jgi:hypothetical protein
MITAGRRKKGGTQEESCLALFPNFFQRQIVNLSQEDVVNIQGKLNSPIPECCKSPVTYMKVLEKLSNTFEQPIFIVGGAVRDYMITKDVSLMNDIDINYTIDVNQVEKALTDLQITHYYKDDRNYIRVGPKSRSDYIEGFYINPQSYSDFSLECKMNSLMFCVSKDTIFLIDLFGGAALEQATQKIWESPTKNYDQWFAAQQKLLWRLLKFELRGYTVPYDTKYAVYLYWITSDIISDYHWENMWWTLNPDNIQQVILQMDKDCKEVGQDFTVLLNKILAKKLLKGNKIGDTQALTGGKKHISLDKCTVEELKARAAKRGIKVTGLKKAEILAKLRKHK